MIKRTPTVKRNGQHLFHSFTGPNIAKIKERRKERKEQEQEEIQKRQLALPSPRSVYRQHRQRMASRESCREHNTPHYIENTLH